MGENVKCTKRESTIKLGRTEKAIGHLAYEYISISQLEIPNETRGICNGPKFPAVFHNHPAIKKLTSDENER